MKIFNWMHRKFNVKDQYGKNVKKGECIAKETDTKALLENEMLDGWKGGLLTIGTLGFDPLQKFIDLDEYSDDHENEYHYFNEEQEAEVDPLFCTTLKHSDQELNDNHKIAAKDNIIINIHGNPSATADDDYIMDFNPDNLEQTDDDKSKKKERTTLADLFSADKDNKEAIAAKPNDHATINGCGHQECTENSMKLKPSTQAKHGLSFAKKLIPRVSDVSRPIHKLDKLMTKMLKKKIHPEIDQWKSKKTSQSKPSMLRLLSNNKHGDSFLPQGVEI